MSKKLVTQITLALAIIAVPAGIMGSGATPENPELVTLTSGWQYRWGDSPVDSSGAFEWLSGRGVAGWNTLTGLEWPPGRDGREWVWYRMKLPSITYAHPTLYLPNVVLAFDVYLGADMIYEFGTMEPDRRNKYAVTRVHLIPLPPGYEGEALFLRIYSNVFAIGLEGLSEPPLVGTDQDIIRRIILGGIESMALGLFVIFAGLFSLLTFVIRFRDKLMAPLSFAAFSICLGLFYIMTPSATQLLIECLPLKMYTMTISFLLFPVGMFAYLQLTVYRTVGATMRRVIWVLFSLHAGFAVVLIALDLLGVVMLPIGMRAYNILFVATIPVAVVTTLSCAMKGSTAARIAVLGFVVFGITGFVDLLQGLQVIPMWHWVSQWGALLFVGCLGYVLERQFTESHQQLKVYTERLREKSEQLEEYSRTLEEKVVDRTRTLDEKNVQLESTLDELKETQHQLIIKEKMASLGNLVAGVAHEVNNPIGAVISASDVSSRCIRIVDEFVREKAGDGDPKVKMASGLLDENTRVISEAARRVAEIVRSLKNFARLDEAELQKANVHDGIDDTLTLVKHLLENRIDVVKEYGNVPDIMVFPNQLNQVYMNLIVNAIDAIEGQGTVTIRTHSDSLNAYIGIADTGKGIPAENLRHIFDPGFTTKGVGVGTGLGLSISYRFIQRHNGALEVESESGTGTKFTIVLPLKQIRIDRDQPDS